MAFLAVNGIEIPILRSGITQTVEKMQDAARAFDGTARRVTRARKRVWNGRLSPQTQSLADAYRQLIEGAGHVWGFEGASTYSSKGLVMSAGNAVTAGGQAKWGGYGLIDNGVRLAYAEWAGAIPATSGWTVMLWRADGASTAWRHWLVTSSGLLYVDGAASAVPACATVSAGTVVVNARDKQENLPDWAASTAKAVGDRISVVVGARVYVFECTVAGTTGATAPTWPSALNATVADGSVTWRNDGLTLQVDDVVTLPYVVPTDWIAPLYAEHSARAFSLLDRVRLSGDAILNGPISAIGECDDSPISLFGSGGSLVTNGESWSFRLQES